MKKVQLSILALLLGTSFFSCTDAKVKDAEKNVQNYARYVDSISVVSTENIKQNWNIVESTTLEKKLQAQSSVETIKDNPELKEKINIVNSKYNEFRIKYQQDVDKMNAAQAKLNFRNAFFSGTAIGEEMNFDWVNKDNILSVYDLFVSTASKNKDSYSREEWDEIKLMYEALDTRKNTVEKEGLTSADNFKIAKLKLKFAPMFTFNRMGAKSEENSAAKK
jgi:hypothetical protein